MSATCKENGNINPRTLNLMSVMFICRLQSWATGSWWRLLQARASFIPTSADALDPVRCPPSILPLMSVVVEMDTPSY